MTLTAPRRRALEVMAASHPRPARYSNSTAPAVPGTRVCALVYWQPADWLRDKGLARPQDDGDRLVLTAAGLKACREAGIPVRERAGVA